MQEIFYSTIYQSPYNKNSHIALNKLFVQCDISDYLTYNYSLKDIRGYKIDTSVQK